MSDRALEQRIGKYVRDMRLQQNVSQAALAESAGISRSTLSLLERGETGNVVTLIQVLRVLDRLDVLAEFLSDVPMSPMTLAKLHQAKRKRARTDRNSPDTLDSTSDW